MNKIPAVRSSAKIYESIRQTDAHLAAENLDEDQLYQLLMRNRGTGSEVYLTNARIENIRLQSSIGQQSLKMILLDRDCQTGYVVDSTVREGVWAPDREVFARDRLAELVIYEGVLLSGGVELDVDRIFDQRDLVIVDDPSIHDDQATHRPTA